ncbi:hypothetical protein [Actinomadura opuntiae]|uniref:hypothetical protein n=1 Tax=Actinomadura sp. OS1-43 TaxID=604315 RepID=UPI00255AFABF|nr:hypothetical protein [Actinomadura sp. OS1-43]MDL4821080.1 hypothetical protein [Actinomadura sp. OS1-43]
MEFPPEAILDPEAVGEFFEIRGAPVNLGDQGGGIKLGRIFIADVETLWRSNIGSRGLTCGYAAW